MSRYGFIFWFAVRDVRRAGVWKSTAACVLTMAAVVLAALLTFGILHGQTSLKHWEIENDPATLAMWIRPRSDVERSQDLSKAGRFAAEDLAQLSTRLNETLGGTRLRGMHPFRELRGFPQWITATETMDTPIGRTVAPDDPVLASYLSRDELADFSSGVEQRKARRVIVSKSLVEMLGYRNEVPKKLCLRCSPTLKIDVPIIVVDRPLPLEHEFLFPQKWYEELEDANRPYMTGTVRTGLLPSQWPKPTDVGFPKAVADELKSRGVKVREAGVGERVWQLEAKSDRSSTFWEALVDWLGRNLAAETKVSSEEFGGFQPIQPKYAEPSGRTPPDWVGIFTNASDDFIPVGRISKEMNLTYDENVVDQIIALGHKAREKFYFSLGAVLGLALLSIVNLAVVQQLVVRQKSQALGMLKAIGVSGRTMSEILACETILIWCVAFGIATCTAVLVGPSLAHVMLEPASSGKRDTPNDQAVTAAISVGELRLFELQYDVISCVAISSLVVAIGVSLFATWRTQRLSPAAVINGHA